MTDIAVQATAPVRDVAGVEAVSLWLTALSEAIASRDADTLAGLFRADAVARDLLALSWDFRNGVGRDEIIALLGGEDTAAPRELAVRAGTEPTTTEDSAEAFLTFSNAMGNGNGYVYLARNGEGAWEASAFVLVLDAIDSHTERVGADRPAGRVHGPRFDRASWAEQRDPEFMNGDPAVVILGAGHNGLMLAARLGALGIRALIVEQNDRVGDNWRKRYSSLALHTPLESDTFPYLPFPPTWPKFTPKDKLADFLECYATLLDLNVWTGSRVEKVGFDETTRTWGMDVVRPDGTRRHLAPRHFVFATGINAEPRLPELRGRDEFEGTLIHAVDYKGHQGWRGKKAIVVGSGVSGHDLAQDLAEHGADVTMIQRSGTLVMNTETFHQVMHGNHVSGRYAVEDADLVNAATPMGALPEYFGAQQRETANAADRELLESLTAAGFELNDGPGGQGALGLIYGLNGTGYYYNAGASELIADGTIALEHGSVERLTATGVQLADGRVLDGDLVIFATGYNGAPTIVRHVLGDDIADQLGAFADVGEDREYGLLWRDCGIDRLWLMISLSVGDGRFYSKLLALQIAAQEAETSAK
ncbi:flavin-containing monooxygenase [Streptomyces carpinensis]|nr:NAD(P)/FAD-dependent oxidoreductase [Streptomyces carpinensis]